jgi:folate-binding protein YgfZ
MDQTAELLSFRESAVLLDGQTHGILRATGNDRVNFLHRVTSGKVVGVEVGQGSRTLLLDVRGHVLATLLVFLRSESVRLIVPAEQVTDVVAGLSKFAIMDDFRIEPEPEIASLAVLGPKAALALAAVGVSFSSTFLEAPLFTHLDVDSEAFGQLWIAHGRACGTDGLCVVAKRAAGEALAHALLAQGTPRLPLETIEALRIQAMEPKLGAEIAPDRFPVEVGLGKAIDHNKGCYVGQETIVRMRDRGTIRKRLVLVQFLGVEMPHPGDKIAAENQPTAGLITSVGCLPGQSPMALAIVATSVPLGAKVQIQRESVLLDATIASEIPPWG